MCLQEARGSHTDALTQLLGALFEVARDAAYRCLRDLPSARDDAWDVAQDVVIRIASRLHQCHARTDRELVSWTVSITRRAVADLIRSPAFRHERSRSAPVELRTEELELAAFRGWRDQESQARPSELTPGERTTSQEEATRATSADGRLLVARATDVAYGALSASKREVIRAHLVEAARWIEVGARLGITPSAAKRRYQRAMVELQDGILGVVAALPEEDRKAALRVLLSWGVSIDPGHSDSRRRRRAPQRSRRG